MRMLATILGWSGLALFALWPSLTAEAAETVTVFSVGLATDAKQTDPAKALIRFLSGPAAAPVYKAKGLGG